DRAVTLDRDEGRDRTRVRVEKPEPGGSALGEGFERAPEESLHAVVHEARLAHPRAPVKREKVAESRRDLARGAHGRDMGAGGVTFKTSHLSLELVAVFSGKAG